MGSLRSSCRFQIVERHGGLHGECHTAPPSQLPGEAAGRGGGLACPLPLCRSWSHIGTVFLQEADTEAGRQIISEEVMRFIREGCSGEVRMLSLQPTDSFHQPLQVCGCSLFM